MGKTGRPSRKGLMHPLPANRAAPCRAGRLTGPTRGRRLRTLAAVPLVATIVMCIPPRAHGLGASAEVEELLLETRFERPPSPTETSEFVARLRRRGIETLTDLRPYIRRSEAVRQNALIAIEHIGNIDHKTLKLIENLVLGDTDSPAGSVATATRIVLNSSPRQHAMAFALQITTRVQFRPLAELMDWAGLLDPAPSPATGDLAQLVHASLDRLRSLFAAGAYSGRWPMTFSLLVERPVFAHHDQAEAVTRPFITTVRNADLWTDMKEIALISSFVVISRNARLVPRLVEAGLTDIVTTGSQPLAKLVVWRMATDSFDRSPAGRRVVTAAIARSPDLADYVERLQSLYHRGAHVDVALRNEIKQAFDALAVPVERAAAAGEVTPARL
jgi:hypothetical protein